MKELKLKALALGAAEVLTRAQMKNVLGSEFGGGGGAPNCANDDCTGACTAQSGPCKGYSGSCGKNGAGTCQCAVAC